MAGRSTESLDDRYWSKVDRRGPDDCWEWTAYRNKLGYGCFGVDGGTALAHRFGFELAHGSFDSALCVLHRCDNPPCQNPAHLFLGTRLDNARDRNAKERQARGERSGPSQLTADQVRAIHAGYSAGKSMPQLASEFGVHKATIDAMVKGRSWTHLGLKWNTRPGRLNPARVRDIRRRFAEGESRHAIAADYCIKPKYVNEIASRRNWAQVA